MWSTHSPPSSPWRYTPSCTSTSRASGGTSASAKARGSHSSMNSLGGIGEAGSSAMGRSPRKRESPPSLSRPRRVAPVCLGGTAHAEQVSSRPAPPRPPGGPVPEPTLAKPPSPAPPDDTLLELLRRSALLRLLAVGALVLLLQIPISMIRGVIGEREARRNEALAEVSASWGGPERIFGPRLVVPYEVASEHTDSAGATRTRRELRHAHFLPEVLEASGDADTDLLHRGI